MALKPNGNDLSWKSIESDPIDSFTREINDPDCLSKLSNSLGSEIEVHYVQCPPDVRRTRLADRGDARDQPKLEDWDNYIRYYGDESVPVFEHTLIDGTSDSL